MSKINSKADAATATTTAKKMTRMTWDEFMSFYNHQFDEHEKDLELARDIFCFACATSLCNGDLERLSKSCFDKHDDPTSFTFVCKKTGKNMTINLNEWSKSIYMKYKDIPTQNGFLFPPMSRYKLNRCLKNTAKMLYGDHRADAISNHTARRTFLSNIANEIYERLTEVFECTEFDVYRSENTITIEKLMDSDDGITAIELEFYDGYITIYGLYHGCGVDINDVVSIESDDVDDIYEKIEDMLCIAYGKIAENDMRGFLLQYYEE